MPTPENARRGTAEADVIKLKIASMTSDNYAVIETAKALSTSGFKLVPDIVAGGDGGGSNSLMNIFLARLIKDSNTASIPKTLSPLECSTLLCFKSR